MRQHKNPGIREQPARHQKSPKRKRLEEVGLQIPRLAATSEAQSAARRARCPTARMGPGASCRHANCRGRCQHSQEPRKYRCRDYFKAKVYTNYSLLARKDSAPPSIERGTLGPGLGIESETTTGSPRKSEGAPRARRRPSKAFGGCPKVDSTQRLVA